MLRDVIKEADCCARKYKLTALLQILEGVLSKIVKKNDYKGGVFRANCARQANNLLRKVPL